MPMKSNGLIVVMNIAIVASFFSGSAACAARVPRIELLREIHIPGTSVLLSDLLPEGASVPLHKRASEVSLGAAPKPGTMRVLEQAAVKSSIGSSPGVLSEIVIPNRIVVSREVRPITLSEVFDAISKSLAKIGLNEWALLSPDDLLLQSQVLVSPGDAGLQVLRADADTGLRRARFLLWPSNDPKVVPFFVTARLDKVPPLGLMRLGPMWSRNLAREGIPIRTREGARQVILVSAGVRATLVLHSEVLRMFADVIPLERGALGQRIRVRMEDTGKIFSAQVDGRAHLDSRF